MYVARFKISAKNNLGFLIQSVDWAGDKTTMFGVVKVNVKSESKECYLF